jgi:hypothetical protein
MALKALATSAMVAVALSELQSQEPRRLAGAESIPVELATALIAAGGLGGEPQILVGSMPEWASGRIVIPEGGHLVGSAFLGMTVVAVVSIPGDADSVMAGLRNQLLQHGWKNPPPQPIYGGGGGFRPAPSPVSPAAPSGFRSPLCGDQQMLIVTSARRRVGGSDITYRLISTSGYSACHPAEPPPQTYHSPFPTLYNPPSAVEGFAIAACQSNGASNGTGTLLRSSMTAEALLDHYGRQIVDSGWTAIPGQILGRRWTKQDSTGAPVEMSLTVVPVSKDGACQRLDLQVKTAPKPR